MISPLLAIISLFSLHSSLAAPSGTHHVPRAESHEVSALFRRQSPESKYFPPLPLPPRGPRHATYPDAGSIPPSSSIPKAWLDKLATIQLPSIPVATGAETGRPSYGNLSPTSSEVCSFTYECDHADDLKVPPAGRYAMTFDDGPAEGSQALSAVLGELGARSHATHFMIGSYITRNPTLFDAIAAAGGHIGVHTWSHNYMTTLSNEAVVAELGWAMQLMADRNGGRIPRYWRPPYGDVDNRVRAIAKGVFGLETVTWSQDTGDWNLDQGNGVTVETITTTFTTWLNDKSVGLNVLEHEVRPSQAEVVKVIYPKAKELGWQVGTVADMWGLPWYHNAQNGSSPVVSMAVGGTAPSITASGGPSASAGSASSSNAASSSMSVTSVASGASSATASASSTSATDASVTTGAVAAAATSSRSAGHALERPSIPLALMGFVVGWWLL